MQSADLRRTARHLERWFERHQRPLPWRDRYDPYRVWVSEVMLQQTRMEVALPYFDRFVGRFPDLPTLAAASLDDVLAAWSGLGYYRRAKMLHAGAAYVVDHLGGVIPSRTEDLLEIPGIGRYTAGAIASVAFEQRVPLVDGNVARVVSRLFATDDDPWMLAGALVEDCRSPRNLNQGLMELGALVCKPRNPACLLCPLRDDCVARATGRVEELPAAKVKKASQAMRIPIYFVQDRRGRVLLHRVWGPLMDAMYHLPHGDRSLFDDEPLAATVHEVLGSFRHTVTTRRIEFVVHAATIEGKARTGFTWVDPARLDEIPHPSYVKKALKIALPASSGRRPGKSPRRG